MKILFIHQNFPGQFSHLARHYGASPKNQVIYITKRKEASIDGVRKILYETRREPSPTTHRYIRGLEKGVLHGQAVAEKAIALADRGFAPDIVVAHPGWGESLYIKDVFPHVPLLNYFEFFYRSEGSDVGFGEGRSVSPDERARVRTKNGINLLSLDACDWGLTATRWQWQQYPEEYCGRISIIHEGVDTVRVAPCPNARFELPDGRTLTRDEEVVTYVARNLEPYRGFPTFMRAVEAICHRRPRAHILIVGGDEISYGSPLPNGETYRERLLSEVSVDVHRVHFLGRVPYPQFLRLLQVSSVHVYLTYPFVLSWSMLEAMASGCLVIGSATPPVQEVLEDGRNGLLVDFFSPDEIADRVDEVLGHRDRMGELRRQARETILQGYDLAHCLPRQLELIEHLAAGRTP